MKRTLNYTSVLAQAFIDAYNLSQASSIYDLETEPSTLAVGADWLCHIAWKSEGGSDYRILEHSSISFIAAWRIGDALRVETIDANYVIPEAF